MNKEKALALRKLREIKELNRKEAGILLGLGQKSVEKLENNRTHLSNERIYKIVKAYGFTIKDFELCLKGKSKNLKERFKGKKAKVLENNSLRRSYKRIVTKEVKVLTSLRRLKGLTQYEASFRCGYAKCTIGHIENGRIELSEARIRHILKSYKCTLEEFQKQMASPGIISELQDECIEIIRRFNEDKLKIVRPLLENL